MKKTLLLCSIAIVAAALLTDPALASSTSSLPYASGLSKFTDSLIGLAPYISLGAFFVAGVMVFMGGDLGGWVKQMITACVIVGTLSGAKAIYDYLFGTSGFLL